MENKKTLDKSIPVVIYGAGFRGHDICNALKRSGYIIAYCVVTNKKADNTDYEDLKVFSFDEKKGDIINNQYQIVIATFERYEAEICDYIKNNGIHDFWKINELPWNNRFTDYEKRTPEEYVALMKSEFQGNSIKYENENGIKSFWDNNGRVDRKDDSVIMLFMTVMPRNIKIIKALKKNGYHVEILLWVAATMIDDAKILEVRKHCDKMTMVDNADEILLRAAASDASVMHIFSTMNQSMEISQIIINAKGLLPKIVYDQYDVATGAYRNSPQYVYEQEQFCLANADGLCNRYASMDYLEGKGYTISNRRIYFPDYCNDDMYVFDEKQKEKNDEIHLVYIGSLLTGDDYYESVFERLLEFADICSRNNTHLHIYPSTYDEEKLYDFFQKEKGNSSFHMHRTLSWNELRKEISQYDFGVCLAKKGFLEYSRTKGIYSGGMVLFSSANKKYDYLEAGLPIICANQLVESSILAEDGVLLQWCDEDVDFDYLREHRQELKQRVLEVRDKYKISNQIHRLIRFYKSL